MLKVFGLMLLAFGTVQASLITTAAAGATTTTFAGGSTICAGSCSGTDAGFGITISSGGGVFNYDHTFVLLSNGAWNPNGATGFAMIGDESGSSTVTINLGAGYSSAGGFINYSESATAPTGPKDPTITALAADGTTVLESDDLATLAPISTPGGNNAGAFRGISLANNSIYYLQISGSFIVEHDISLTQMPSSPAVPEPSSFGLLASGVAFACYCFKRRNKFT
jgi:hypothetical protein